MEKKILLVFIILFCTMGKSITAQNKQITELSDSSFVSILTTYPNGEQVYTLFGHSAIRVCDMADGRDFVFNYGLFNFNSPNFIYRFTAGKTDYMVGAIPYSYYLPEYESRGVEVREQKIDLTTEEKQKIWYYLLHNIQKENRVYRYNIFFNNCTTKLADILEHNIDGKITFAENKKQKTFRNVLHEHLQTQPWLKFGIDIIIGSEADRVMTTREHIFLPVYEYNIFNDSQITDKNQFTRPLVASDTVILSAKAKKEEAKSWFRQPLFIGIFVLILILFTGLSSLRKKCGLCTFVHFSLFFVAGILGCILFFMMFFSVHPCTNPNWNLVWLNPLQLLAAFLLFAKPKSKGVYYYHFVNFVLLALFLLAWCLIPQKMEIAFIPYIISLGIVSAIQVLKHKKLTKS